MTFPDPYDGGAGQGATQPPRDQGYNQPPPGPGYGQPGEAYGQAPPSQGFTAAPAVGPGYGQYPMAAAPQGMYVDQMSGLLLPDGTELASVGRRIGAYFLSIPLAIVTLGIGYIIWGLIVWGNGQTPALQVLGMRVWRPETNRVAGFGHMALREIVGRIADGILSLITEITSFVLFVSSRDRKSLHDHVAGTVVLYDPNKTLAS
ncbi:MAG: RDD family protein [Streptosporangiaceae bacterium]